MPKCPNCGSLESKTIGSLYYQCLKCKTEYSSCPLCSDTGDLWFSDEDQKKHDEWMKHAVNTI